MFARSIQQYNFSSYRGGNGGSFRRNFGDEQIEVAGSYTQNNKRIKTMTLEEIVDVSVLNDIRPQIKERLESQGITELFPVQ